MTRTTYRCDAGHEASAPAGHPPLTCCPVWVLGQPCPAPLRPVGGRAKAAT